MFPRVMHIPCVTAIPQVMDMTPRVMHIPHVTVIGWLEKPSFVMFIRDGPRVMLINF